jgi:hypothetical protein
MREESNISPIIGFFQSSNGRRIPEVTTLNLNNSAPANIRIPAMKSKIRLLWIFGELTLKTNKTSGNAIPVTITPPIKSGLVSE